MSDTANILPRERSEPRRGRGGNLRTGGLVAFRTRDGPYGLGADRPAKRHGRPPRFSPPETARAFNPLSVHGFWKPQKAQQPSAMTGRPRARKAGGRPSGPAMSFFRGTAARQRAALVVFSSSAGLRTRRPADPPPTPSLRDSSRPFRWVPDCRAERECRWEVSPTTAAHRGPRLASGAIFIRPYLDGGAAPSGLNPRHVCAATAALLCATCAIARPGAPRRRHLVPYDATPSHRRQAPAFPPGADRPALPAALQIPVPRETQTRPAPDERLLGFGPSCSRRAAETHEPRRVTDGKPRKSLFAARRALDRPEYRPSAP